MEMLARRTAMAERQVARRLARRAKVDQRPPRHPPRELREEASYRLAMARVARREDWHLGPLAPRRDVGEAHAAASLPRARKPLYHEGRARTSGKKLSLPSWGSIDREAANLTFKPLDWQLEERWAWAGGRRYPSVVPGDRVIVMDGPNKGEIGKVESVDESMGTLKIEGIGIVNVQIPEFLRHKANGNSTAPYHSSLPVSAVRLVHPMRDPETGETRDVVIRELVARDRVYDRPTGRREWNRMVPGLNVLIPWPERAREEHEDQPSDTLRIEVEKRTYVPTLSAPPMPAAVVDELRNRFSKFRTRHTDEYVAAKQAEVDAKKARAAGLADTMLTPIQEYNRVQRERRAATPPPVLTEAMLEKIGEVMERNRTRAAAAAEHFQDVAAPLPADLPAASQPPPS
ncbi:hypothetical protein RB594_004445 [Gaeumannomyces avenae]